MLTGAPSSDQCRELMIDNGSEKDCSGNSPMPNAYNLPDEVLSIFRFMGKTKPLIITKRPNEIGEGDSHNQH